MMRRADMIPQALLLLAFGATLAGCGEEPEPSTDSLVTGGTGATPYGGIPSSGGLQAVGAGGASGGVGTAPSTGGMPTTGGVPSGGAPSGGGTVESGATGSATADSGAAGLGLSGTGSGAAGTGLAGTGAAGTGAAGTDGDGGNSAAGSGSAGMGAAGTGAAGTGAAGLGGGGGADAGAAGSRGAQGGGGAGAADSGAAGSDPAGSSGSSGGYALPPPDECSNQFAVQDCKAGDPASRCGGACSNDNGPTAKNACEGGKPGVPVQYACPRHMLFSSEMNQAVAEDGYEGAFNYAIVGHDPDPSNLDAGLPNSCCQCYQLVFDVPTYLTASTLTPPPPLIVQSANTAASGATGFDVFMGAGGLGAFNACYASLGLGQSEGYSLYTGYPSVGQAFSGGVKPGPDSVNCADEHNNLSDALISDPVCQDKIAAACNEITAADPVLEADTRRSCIQSNQAATYYHENWNVYAKRVACPTHLMEVTGCKLPPEPGLAAPDPAVLTAAQAAAAGFSSGYHTTTMQDCCMPTCAWSNNVQVETVDGYNSFYSCLEDGTPVTQ